MKRKLTVNQFALSSLKHRKKQYSVLFLGIILAMVFSSAVPFFISCAKASQKEMHNRQLGKQDLLVINPDEIDWDTVKQAEIIDGEIGSFHVLSYDWSDNKKENGTTVAWLDQRAEDLYYPQVKEGRFPQKVGEIAIEEDALMRMGLKVNVGDTLTFQSLARDGADYLDTPIETSYTLVGILPNRRPVFENCYADIGSNIPAAFVWKDTQVQLGGKEAQIALMNLQPHKPDFPFSEFFGENAIRMDVLPQGLGYQFYDIAYDSKLSAFLSLLLAFLACFGIANIFYTHLKERKKQIGMMRAVGATKRQIIWIFGHEAFWIAAICTPISIIIAYFGVKLYALCMGEDFIFMPNLTVLFVGALFGMLCILLSALLPLISISRLSPLRAIRDADLMWKMKRKKIKSKQNFRMPRLLAQRKLLFSKKKTAFIRFLLVLTTLLCCFAVSDFRYSVIIMRNSDISYDYSIRPSAYDFSSGFINTPSDGFISEVQRQEALQLPHVQDIYGNKEAYVNLLMDEVSPYLLLGDLFKGTMYSHYVEPDWFAYDADHPLTKETFMSVIQAEENPQYTTAKERADYTQEALNIPLRAYNENTIQNNFENIVVEGSINLEKLNSGEEIILEAPSKIGYYWRAEAEAPAASWGLLNLSPAAIKKTNEIYKKNSAYVLATAESPFHAGDTITLSMLVEDKNGNLTREDRDVRIGAILDDQDANASTVSLYTTLEGLDQFGHDFPYSELFVELSTDYTAEQDYAMQNQLSNIFYGQNIDSSFEMRQRSQDANKSILLTFGALVAVLYVVCISLINNMITAQIQEGKRSIGTLRAVGAAKQDIIHCYIIQIFDTVIWGVVIGLLLKPIVEHLLEFTFVVKTIGWFNSILPALILFAMVVLVCYINLQIQIEKVSRFSIVENIREL